MALQFTLEQANALVSLVTPSGFAAPSPNVTDEQLHLFIGTIANDLFLSKRNAHLRKHIKRIAENSRHSPRLSFNELQMFLSDLRLPWIAMFLPGIEDSATNALMKERSFLSNIMDQLPLNCLLLQTEEGFLEAEKILSLKSVFPAVKTALANGTRWPGIVIWDESLNSLFFEMDLSPDLFKADLLLLLRRMSENTNLREVWYEFYSRRRSRLSRTHILHLSDLHLGHPLAQEHLPRLKQLIQSTVDELHGDKIIPVLTGDLMHSPNETNLKSVIDFQNYLWKELKLEQPIIVPGNHDSRFLGFIPSKTNKQLSRLSKHTDLFVPYHQSGLGFLRFDSNEVGCNVFALARGRICKKQMQRIGSEIDKFGSEIKNLNLVALVHHHPISVQKKNFLKAEWYQTIFGPFKESTGEFENADAFLSWLQIRRIPIVLHGHKHIPHVSSQNGTIIVGCGSSTGKVKTTSNLGTYLSFNVLTLDGANVVVRIKAETVAGAGLEEDTHELVMYRKKSLD